jgi:broad specificity phosphatase PhoE
MRPPRSRIGSRSGTESPLPDKILLIAAALLWPLLSGFAADPSASPVIYVVRHAEKSTEPGNDPALSEAGRARAESLARILRDAQIAAIYTTEFKRTQETAAPLAKTLGVQATVIPSAQKEVLADKCKAASSNILVVGHGNTIPDLLKALGISDSISIAENEYGNLFIVVGGQQPRLLRLHFQ